MGLGGVGLEAEELVVAGSGIAWFAQVATGAATEAPRFGAFGFVLQELEAEQFRLAEMAGLMGLAGLLKEVQSWGHRENSISAIYFATYYWEPAWVN
jgi:hypothetical protein